MIICGVRHLLVCFLFHWPLLCYCWAKVGVRYCHVMQMSASELLELFFGHDVQKTNIPLTSGRPPTVPFRPGLSSLLSSSTLQGGPCFSTPCNFVSRFVFWVADRNRVPLFALPWLCGKYFRATFCDRRHIRCGVVTRSWVRPTLVSQGLFPTISFMGTSFAIYYIFPVGFNGNLSLLDIFVIFPGGDKTNGRFRLRQSIVLHSTQPFDLEEQDFSVYWRLANLSVANSLATRPEDKELLGSSGATLFRVFYRCGGKGNHPLVLSHLTVLRGSTGVL